MIVALLESRIIVFRTLQIQALNFDGAIFVLSLALIKQDKSVNEDIFCRIIAENIF